MDEQRTTIRYAGHLLDARNADGKIWFAVDGHATLSRRLRRTRDGQHEKVTPTSNVTASVHVVPTWPASGDQPLDGGEYSSRQKSSTGGEALLLKAAQVNPMFACATALPPGIHIMCGVQTSSDHAVAEATRHDDESNSNVPAPLVQEWRAVWEDLKTGDGPAEQAERLQWQQPCFDLLKRAGTALHTSAISSAIDEAPSTGWAPFSCAPDSDSLACVLARGGGAEETKGFERKAMWIHFSSEGTASALADNLLLASGKNSEPAYASLSAHEGEDGQINITAEAHRTLSDGVLSGYTLKSDRRADQPLDEKDDHDFETARFVDESSFPAETGKTWRGTVSAKELPGGGLHRHVRVAIDASCPDHSCREDLDMDKDDRRREGQNQWCEVLLSQHLPQGVYIDVDEVKARHDFEIVSSLPTRPRLDVETFEGRPIDIELPSSASGQHVVNFKLWVALPNRGERTEGKLALQAEMTLPVHLRYPDLGCQHRGEECSAYEWVQVPPPVASIRCGWPGELEPFSDVLPSVQPVGVELRVPRGIAWHRDFVVCGTIVAALLGCLYTLHTLWTVSALGVAHSSRASRRTKAHDE